jgi:hypothetical protein
MKLWILGRAGWYLIKPSDKYLPIFRTVLQKALLWTWIEDNKEPKKQPIESLAWTHEDGGPRAMSLLDKHHRFLITRMHENEISKKEWRNTTVWDWCTENYPDEIVEVDRIMKRQRSRHTAASRRGDPLDPSELTFVSARPVGTPHDRVKQKLSATSSSRTRVKNEKLDSVKKESAKKESAKKESAKKESAKKESAKEQSVRSQGSKREKKARVKKEPSSTPQPRSTRSSRREESSPRGETIHLASLPPTSRRRLKLVSSPEPFDATDDDAPAPHPMFSGKGRMSAQIKRPRSSSPDVEEDPVEDPIEAEEDYRPPSSGGYYSFKKSGLRPRKSSISLANSSISLASPEQDDELQKRFDNVNRMLSIKSTPMTTPPLPALKLETPQPARKRRRMGTRSQPILVQDGTRSKPILVKDEPESDQDDSKLDGWPDLRPGRGRAPISGSTALVGFSGGEWICELDGCKFKVEEPDTPAGGSDIEKHYEQHGEKMRAAMKVLGVECQPVGERKVE